MKFVDEFRDGTLAKGLASAIAREANPGRRYSFMEFCGGHTHAISRYGVSDLLPANIRLVHGPGCPVCVLPVGRIDMAIRLALEHRVILCTYGDTLRVPASDGLVETASAAHLQVNLGSSIAETEQRLILATLEHFHGDKEKTARTLGISLKTLYNKLGPERPRREPEG